MYISCYYGNVQAPHRADNFGTGVPSPTLLSPATALVQPAPYNTTGPVGGVWRVKHKPYFDNVSLIDSDSFQVSCRFPNLMIGHVWVQ